MSIQSALGNITANAFNDLQTLISGAKTKLQGIVGGIETALTNIWDGGFAGIDENNLDTLKDALNTYCNSIDEIILGFDQTTNLDVAYKGAINEAANDFVDAVKEILTAYVSTMRRNIAEADTAFANYKQAAQSIAQDVKSDAADIRSEAQKIRLD